MSAATTLLHGELEMLPQGDRFCDSGIAPGHQDLVHRFHLLATAHGPEVMDRATDHL
jgi:hypothetical protein